MTLCVATIAASDQNELLSLISAPMRSRTFIAVLIASVGLNTYLGFERLRSASEPLVVPKSDRPLRPLRFVPSASHPRSYRSLNRDELERRVFEAEADVERYMPLDERYERDLRSTKSEASVRPFLNSVFSSLPEAHQHYEVECHGRVCRLTTPAAPELWMEPLQNTPESMILFRGTSFGVGETFLELNTEGEQLTQRIHLAARSAVDVCLTASSTQGDLSMRLLRDGELAKLEISGSLANDEVAGCVARAYQEPVRETPVPAGVSIEDNGISFTLPLE